jgi:sugar (pentulose or hexulose) kinase
MLVEIMKSADKTTMKSLVIGLDCSTTGTKAIAFDKKGRIAAAAHASNPLFSPKPGYYEQNAQDWWFSARKALRTITGAVDPKRIAALAISNQRETFVSLNENGRPIRPAIAWLDERCKGEVESFSKKIGKEIIHRITGKPVDYAPVVYRLAWMKSLSSMEIDRAFQNELGQCRSSWTIRHETQEMVSPDHACPGIKGEPAA